MNVLLLTLYGNYNYGNRLQNYALQTVLEQYHCDVYNLYTEDFDGASYVFKDKIKDILLKLGLFKNRWSSYIEKKNPVYREKVNRFSLFTDEYMHNKVVLNSIKDLEYKNFKSIDIGITGSDQVWHNWSGSIEELEYFYLSFLSKEKRYSYAASFGFNKFSDIDKNIHEKYLKEMNNISVREKNMVNMIKDLSGKDSTYVLDPTLLLSKDQWTEIEKNPTYNTEEPYMLVFFLGDILPEYTKTIEDIQRRYGYTVINILDKSNKDYYFTDPNEFIYLFHHAEFICTDSFHATVFSTIFKKDFMVFKRDGRDDMFARIDSLMEILDFKDRIFNGSIYEKSYNDEFDIEDFKIENKKERYIEADKNLAIMKKISLNYLKNILK